MVRGVWCARWTSSVGMREVVGGRGIHVECEHGFLSQAARQAGVDLQRLIPESRSRVGAIRRRGDRRRVEVHSCGSRGRLKTGQSSSRPPSPVWSTIVELYRHPWQHARSTASLRIIHSCSLPRGVFCAPQHPPRRRWRSTSSGCPLGRDELR
jgi:hypothetical protein